MRRLPPSAPPLRLPLLLRSLPDARLATSESRVVSLRVDVPDEILDEIVERVTERVLAGLPDRDPSPPSPYMSIPEAASYLRCSRQRIDDLLSQRRLTRIKDGSRTLVSRAEIEEHLRLEPRRR